MSRREKWALMVAAIVAIIIVLVVGNAAMAHTAEEQAEWQQAWVERVSVQGMTPELLAEWIDFRDRHEERHPSPVASGTSRPKEALNVDGWRPLVESYFPADAVERMLCLMWYESRGDPNAVNPSSGAAGLFQVMPFWWDHYGGDRFDPATNTRVARLIWDQQGYKAWSPYNRGLCR